MDEDDADFVVLKYVPESPEEHGKWITKGSTTFWQHSAAYFCEFSKFMIIIIPKKSFQVH